MECKHIFLDSRLILHCETLDGELAKLSINIICQRRLVAFLCVAAAAQFAVEICAQSSQHFTHLCCARLTVDLSGQSDRSGHN